MKRVFLYLRLSKEDFDKLSPIERSESIKNQELMLKNYALSQNWNIVGVFDDEDFSGSDRDRPNFKQMIKQLKNGNADIVLVKTQSRFARDMELIEQYIHGKFKEWNVRFVTYIGGIDNSKKETKKTSQITAMTDEWMLEDTSDNIRTTLKNKKEAGLFTGSFAPYGYIKDPDDKNHLLIDPIASLVVKKIFELYAYGYGCNKIINYLEESKIPSPYDYKKRNGSKIAHPSNKKRQLTNISKKGSFILSYIIENKEAHKITNVESIGMLSKDSVLENTFPKFIEIKIRKIDKEMKIFYTLASLENKNSFINFEKDNNWIELKVGEIIPHETKYIASYIPEIRRLCRVQFELEITVNYNKKYENYEYYSWVYCDNQNNLKSMVRYEKKYSWSNRTIMFILQNETYIGSLVQGKFKNKSYKDNTKIHIPKKDWIIIPHTHEAIIENDLWNKTQKRLQSISRIDTISGTIHPLSKKVYCKVCGKCLEKNCNANHTHEYLVCRDKRTKWKNCDNRNSIRFDFLEQCILKEFNQFITNFKQESILKSLHNEKIENVFFHKQICTFKNELLNTKSELISKDKYFQQLYEDRVNHVISTSQFYSLSERYNQDIENLRMRQKNIEKELNILYDKQLKLKNINILFQKYSKIDKITLDFSHEWIQKIYVDSINKENHTREIQIIWNF